MTGAALKEQLAALLAESSPVDLLLALADVLRPDFPAEAALVEEAADL